MDLITLTLNKNHLISGISLLGIGALTYFVNRYSNNTKETSNQTYYKPSELIKGIPNLTYINNTNTNTNTNTNNNTNNNTNANTEIFNLFLNKLVILENNLIEVKKLTLSKEQITQIEMNYNNINGLEEKIKNLELQISSSQNNKQVYPDVDIELIHN